MLSNQSATAHLIVAFELLDHLLLPRDDARGLLRIVLQPPPGSAPQGPRSATLLPSNLAVLLQKLIFAVQPLEVLVHGRHQRLETFDVFVSFQKPMSADPSESSHSKQLWSTAELVSRSAERDAPRWVPLTTRKRRSQSTSRPWPTRRARWTPRRRPSSPRDTSTSCVALFTSTARAVRAAGPSPSHGLSAAPCHSRARGGPAPGPPCPSPRAQLVLGEDSSLAGLLRRAAVRPAHTHGGLHTHTFTRSPYSDASAVLDMVRELIRSPGFTER